MTTNEPDKPLWSDDEIIERYRAAFGTHPDVHHMALMRWIRDDLTAQLATLRAERDTAAHNARHYANQVHGLEEARAQLAEWEPVPPGTHGEIDTITIHGGRIIEINSAYGDGSKRHKAIIPLPPGWQLVRTKGGQNG